MLFLFVKLAWVALNVNYRVMGYMIINCTGFIDVYLIECFSVSSNVCLDPRWSCDENFNIMDIFFEGRDRYRPYPKILGDLNFGSIFEVIWGL